MKLGKILLISGLLLINNSFAGSKLVEGMQCLNNPYSQCMSGVYRIDYNNSTNKLERLFVRQGYKFNENSDIDIVVEKATLLAKAKISSYLNESISKIDTMDWGDDINVKRTLKSDIEHSTSAILSGVRVVGTIFKKNKVYVELGISRKSISGSGDIRNYINNSKSNNTNSRNKNNYQNGEQQTGVQRSEDYDTF